MVLLLFLVGIAAAEPRRIELKVAETVRAALVYPPTKGAEAKAPLVLAFHGHGGTGRAFAQRARIHEHWPEAVVVYPQGLNTATNRDPEGRRPGWQNNPGEGGDRDVQFFDALLARLQTDYAIDAQKIYVIGHSNGSRFACLLWAKRGEKIAAFCTSGGQGGDLLRSAPRRPVAMLAGEKDAIVPFARQKRVIDALRKEYGCDETRAVRDGFWRVEPAQNGLEVATYIHPGGHEFPAEAVGKVVAYWKRHPLRADGAASPAK